MKGVAPHDRPREKLERLGLVALGDNELLALILGSGSRGRNALQVANRLLEHVGGLHGLTRVTVDELRRVTGVGRVRAAQVLAAVEMGRRTLVRSDVDRPDLGSPHRLAAYLLPLYGSGAIEQHEGEPLHFARDGFALRIAIAQIEDRFVGVAAGRLDQRTALAHAHDGGNLLFTRTVGRRALRHSRLCSGGILLGRRGHVVFGCIGRRDGR